MSNPVSNVEIEDVLSSIRKLVADEKRASPPARKSLSDRLILTPAQRVNDRQPDTAVEPSDSEPVLLTDPVSPDDSTEEHRRDKAIDDIPGTARLAQYGEVEGLFPDIDDVDKTTGAEPAEDGAARLELGRLIEEEVAAALAGADRDEPSGEAAGQNGFAADDVDWLEDPAEDWGAEETDASDTSDADTRHDASLKTPTEGAADSGDLRLGVPAKSTPMSLEDKVAALGRLVARGKTDFEEDRDAAEDDEIAAAVEPMTWPEQAPFVDMVEPEPESGSNVLRSGAWPAKDEIPETNKGPDTDEAETKPVFVHKPDRAEPAPRTDQPDDRAEGATPPIDEDVLRAMVIEIVRSELQGALGERITRNVRKLVRREIHRMLISQELE